MNTIIKKKLLFLRKFMINNNIDSYIITKFDPHQSEYANEYWNCVKFMSGFTGSNGILVVTKDKAGLWTDARYYLQAESELKGSSIELYKGSDTGIKDFLTFTYDETPPNGVIGFDGRTLSLKTVNSLIKIVGFKNIKLKPDIDLINTIWKDRPKISRNNLFELGIKYCGKTRTEKILQVREKMLENNADIYVISSLDDIAWLLNIRCLSETSSFDFHAYVVLTQNKIYLFIDYHEDDYHTILNLEADGIKIEKYNIIYTFLKNIKNNPKYKTIMFTSTRTNYLLYTQVNNMNIINLNYDITSKLKAIKNNIEIDNLKIANKKDAVAIVRLIKWLKESVVKESISEFDISEKLYSLRKQMDNFKGLSFETISGYNENGAIIHYTATKDNSKILKNSGLLLLDSGANYLEGTTDITRTISLGKITEKMKEYYTLVLKAHISFAKLIFLYGSTGVNLDIAARIPLWENGLNYQHGTGHGIGFFLNVHEGPQIISLQNNSVKLEEGMVMSNEPGVYIKNEFGIRLENTIIIKKFNKTEHGQFMCFETISFIPFDINCIIPDMLSVEEKTWLNHYNKNVYKNLESYLNNEEKVWLKTMTEHI